MRSRWLTRNLVVLSLVSLFQDSASELVYPVLPLFLTGVLGAPVAVVGFVEGAAEGAASITRVFAGRLADKFARRPLVGAGYSLASVGKVLVAAATGWPFVLLGRCVDRLGKGIRGAPRDALIADGVDPRMRGRAFGFHRAADTAGAVIGPLLGLGVYYAVGKHIRPVLWVAVGPAVISALLVIAVRETRKTRTTQPHVEAQDVPRLPRQFWVVTGGLTLFNLVNFPDALLLLRVHYLGYGFAGVVLAYVAYNVSYAALSYPAGALADRMSPPTVYALGMVSFVAGYLGLGLADARWLVWVLLPAYGGFMAATDGVGKAWVSAIVSRDRQGTAQGIFQGSIGAGVLIAGIWAGLAWQHTGRVPLLISGSVGAAFAIALAVGGRRYAPN